jgi:hypothetical protein
MCNQQTKFGGFDTGCLCCAVSGRNGVLSIGSDIVKLMQYIWETKFSVGGGGGGGEWCNCMNAKILMLN